MNVGKNEAFCIGSSLEGDAGLITNGAVHAITADQPTWPDGLCGAIAPKHYLQVGSHRLAADKLTGPNDMARQLIEMI